MDADKFALDWETLYIPEFAKKSGIWEFFDCDFSDQFDVDDSLIKKSN